MSSHVSGPDEAVSADVLPSGEGTGGLQKTEAARSYQLLSVGSRLFVSQSPRPRKPVRRAVILTSTLDGGTQPSE
jgi:hypothetical protein